MNESLTIRIRLFGAFRTFSSYFENSDQLELSCSNPCTIADVRIAFQQLLQTRCPIFNEALLRQSAFANQESILTDTTVINQSIDLIILPPISGG